MTMIPTSTDKRSLVLLAGLVACLLALSGCGSSATKTVSVSGALTTGTVGQPPVTTGTTPSPSTTTTPKGTGTSTTEKGTETTTTRTTTAPAFTKESTSAEGLSAALTVVRAHGYNPANTSDYHSGQTLRVLVGTNAGSGDGYEQQAFFFIGNRYLGTDTSTPSANVKVVAQGDTEVTLAYSLYKPHDPLCCASAGQATVRFQLNNGRLVPLDPIPPESSQTAASRQ
jgi:hypothetical protein